VPAMLSYQLTPDVHLPTSVNLLLGLVAGITVGNVSAHLPDKPE
jgi:hypothetical protein